MYYYPSKQRVILKIFDDFYTMNHFRKEFDYYYFNALESQNILIVYSNMMWIIKVNMLRELENNMIISAKREDVELDKETPSLGPQQLFSTLHIIRRHINHRFFSLHLGSILFAVMLHYTVVLHYYNLTLIYSQYKNTMLHCLGR